MRERAPHKEGGWYMGGEGWRCVAAVTLCSSRRVLNNNELPDLPVYFRRICARADCHPAATACGVCDR